MTRERCRTVKTYHGDRNLNDKIADIIGIKINDYQYKSMSIQSQSTTFTAPPEFDLDEWAKDFLIGFARNHGVELANKDNQRLLCEEFVEKLSR